MSVPVSSGTIKLLSLPKKLSNWRNCLKLKLTTARTCENRTLEKHCCKRCPFESDLAVVVKKHTNYHCIKLDRNKFRKIYSVRSYDCKKCGFITNFALKWLQHTKQNSCKVSARKTRCNVQQKPLQKCPDCSYETQFNCVLRQHVIARHTPLDAIDWVHCDKCPFRGKTKRELRVHRKSRHSDQTFQCEYCPHVYKHASNLRHHVATKHMADTDWRRCPTCDYKCVRKWKLEHHILAQHTPDDKVAWHNCDSCSYRTKYLWYLKRHKISKHVEDEGITWIKCDQCEYATKLESCMKAHKKKKHREVAAI